MGVVIGLLGCAAFIWFIVVVSRGKSSPAPPHRRIDPEPYRRDYEPVDRSALTQSSGLMRRPSESVQPRYRRQGVTNASTARWVAANESATVAGLTIEGGMIYVGGVLPAQYGDNDNCLINPDLAVARAGADTAGQTMGYWPSYERIGGTARLAYLQWLADGRRTPGAYIGYVFLFFYGLERRLFVDNKRDEAPALVAEVERLLDLYGENGSFDMYARRFLDIARLFIDGVPACEPSLDLRSGFEIPFGIRLALGEKLEKGEPFNADEALTWTLALPDCFPRTPVQRCFDEARALWKARFDERYPDGLKVRKPKTLLKATYRPASACFEAQISMADMPDIAAVQAPLDSLRDLLQGCADELDAYSRLLGRRPEAKGTPEAVLLLPPALADTAAGAALQGLREALASRLAGQELALVPVADVIGILGLGQDAGERLSPAVARQMGAMLDRLDVGFEPDRRYGPVSPAAEGQVALFKATGGGPIDPDRPHHVAARTLVEVAVLAAKADGVVVPAEFDAIASDLKAIEAIAADERLRLLALAAVLLKDPPKHQAAVNRLLKLDAAERLRITQTAITAVLSDGRVTPEEVKFLERLHKALGLPPEQVYAALHRGGQRQDGPVTVAVERRADGEAVPAEAPPEFVVVAFDPERLARIRQETSVVSQLLAGIFVEDEVAQPGPPPTKPQQPSAFDGLDAAHSALLAELLSMQQCDRATFETSARTLRLFPDGAIETINEWGFDLFDEQVIEGEDIIAPAEHLLGRLRELGAMA